MKKAFTLGILTVLFSVIFLISCVQDDGFETYETQNTEYPEACPPNDRNCNGIPDNEE